MSGVSLGSGVSAIDTATSSGGGSSTTSYTTAIPLTTGGNAYMPVHVVSGALSFTLAANPVQNSVVYLPLIADGTNIPTFSSDFKQWGNGSEYSNIAGIENQLQFFYDGRRAYYCYSQVVGAVAVATAVTMTGPTSGIISTASTNFTVSISGDITGTVRCTPDDGGHGGTFTPTYLDLSNGAASGTFTYTPNSTVQTDTISLTNNGGLSNPTSISYSALASPTVPGTPTIGTAVAGDTQASVPFTAPGSNGGATITSYTATSTPGSFTGTLSQAGSGTITVTGLTNGTSYTFTVHAHNSVGNSAESSASNSVTPASAVSYPRLQGLSLLTESGTGPYTYTGASGNIFTGSSGGTSIKKSPSGGTTTYDIKIPSGATGFMAGISTSTTNVDYPSWVAGTYFSGGAGTAYQHLGTGTFTDLFASASYAANDILRFSITNTTVKLSRAPSATPTVFTDMFSWTVTAADYYVQVRVDGSTVVVLNAFSGYV